MRFSLFFISLFFFILAGCGVPNNAIKFTPPVTSLPDPASLQAMWNHDKVLTMVAKVSMISPAEKWFFKLGISVQLPDKLRVEYIPMFGLPDFFLTVKGDQFKVFLPKKQEFIIGKASPENLAPFLPMLWGPEKWIAVLLGIYPEEPPYPRQISFFLPNGQQQEIRYTWGWRFEDMEIPGNITFNANNDTTVSIDYIHFSTRENTADDLESDLFDLPIP
ncbi:MAG: hypothetical protein LBV07_01875, partial [Syntrophobacterales bacterium]|nr:hypothetical protein [Syntrophobacterales bacterium]